MLKAILNWFRPVPIEVLDRTNASDVNGRTFVTYTLKQGDRVFRIYSAWLPDGQPYKVYHYCWLDEENNILGNRDKRVDAVCDYHARERRQKADAEAADILRQGREMTRK